jgi:hypothetical protein
MLEIYNEVITDLINPAGTNLQIREDIKRGCYVEDLSEHTIQNGKTALTKTHSSFTDVQHAVPLLQCGIRIQVLPPPPPPQSLMSCPICLGWQKLGTVSCCSVLDV